MKRILFVCLGNICRSPLAEGIFKHKLKALQLEHLYHADSCGTSNYHIGESPDPRTIRNAQINGVELDHAGRQLCVKDFDDYDLILVMDQSNLQNTLRLAKPGDRGKIMMMRDFDPLGRGEDVPDPWFGGDEGFQHVFEILNRSVDGLLDYLNRKA